MAIAQSSQSNANSGRGKTDRGANARKIGVVAARDRIGNQIGRSDFSILHRDFPNPYEIDDRSMTNERTNEI